LAYDENIELVEWLDRLKEFEQSAASVLLVSESVLGIVASEIPFSIVASSAVAIKKLIHVTELHWHAAFETYPIDAFCTTAL
jgi:hypothetical protein